MSQETDIDKFENEVDFTIVKEGWNRYDLADGTKMRARVLLGKVLKGNNTNELFCDISHPVFSISAPDNKRGETGREPQPPEFDEIEKENIEFEAPNEPWNEYDVTELNRKIKIRYSVSTIRRLKNRFDSKGLPYYIVSGSPTVTVI